MPWPTDDPNEYFGVRGFALRVYEDAAEGDWSADLVSSQDERTLQRRYGSGVSADDAAVGGPRRHHVGEEPARPPPRRLPPIPGHRWGRGPQGTLSTLRP